MASVPRLCFFIMLHLGIVMGACPDEEWIRDGDFCYLFRPDRKVNWGRGRYDCIRAGSHKADLVSIATQEESDFVATLMDDFSTETNPTNYWIGLFEEKLSGEWRWGDDTPMTYTNWADGEPGENHQDCAEAVFYEGTWVDASCYSLRGYACKVIYEA